MRASPKKVKNSGRNHERIVVSAAKLLFFEKLFVKSRLCFFVTDERNVRGKSMPNQGVWQSARYSSGVLVFINWRSSAEFCAIGK